MKDFIVVKEVRLKISAKDRAEAAKHASKWGGETSFHSTTGANIEWNGKSKRARIDNAPEEVKT